MEERLDDDILNVVERWQSLGFLEGLPIRKNRISFNL